MTRKFKSYTEWVNPSKIEVKCSDGFVLTWQSKNIPGGSRSKKYQFLLHIFDNYENNAMCKKNVDNLISATI